MRVSWFMDGGYIAVSIEDLEKDRHNLYFFQDHDSIRLDVDRDFLKRVYEAIGEYLEIPNQRRLA